MGTRLTCHKAAESQEEWQPTAFGGRVRAVGYRVREAFESEKCFGPATDCANTRWRRELMLSHFEPKKAGNAADTALTQGPIQLNTMFQPPTG